MKKRTIASSLFPIVTGFTLLLVVGTASAAPANGPGDFIRSVGREAIDSLTGKELSEDQRQARFRAIFDRTFEVPLIARFALGRYWRQTQGKQRQDYMSLFEDYIVLVYATLFQNYNGETFSVGKVRAVNKSDSMVESELAMKDGQRIVVMWRVRGNSDFKIIDVIVEGVSMVITQRDQFASIISQNGGTVDGLLTALRKKTQK